MKLFDFLLSLGPLPTTSPYMPRKFFILVDLVLSL